MLFRSGAWQNSRGEIILGDVIIAIDDRRVENNDDYLSALEEKRPGDWVDITTRRNRKTHDFRLRLAEPQ